jgi:hypothetical protein
VQAVEPYKPLAASASERALIDEPKVVEQKPRELTSQLRKRLGLPAAKIPPYRFGFVALLIALVGVPVLMLGWYKTMFIGSFMALGVLPAMRWYEKREIEKRDRVFTHGKEVVARVLDVEPGGPDRNGKVVRIEFVVGDENPQRIAASVFGCPFARKGLEPGDDVVLYYAEEEPQRCLIVERIARKSSSKARRYVPPKGCGNGGCGDGGCGSGGCGGGGCGGGCGCG